MKTSSFKLLILVMAILVCSLVSQGQATLAFRCTFNDAIHVGTLQEYGVEGTLGAGGYIYIKALSTDIATTAGQGASGNKALVFDEQGDELQIRRWQTPIDQFAEADLTQVASGMSFGYWLMVDTHSSSPMLLLGTRSGDMPNGNTNITHGLRHNGAASPYTSRRAAVEIWTHGGTTSATEFTADVWHHLVFTYSAGGEGSVTKKIYIDGSLAATPTTTGSVTLMPSGAHRIGGFWNGSTYTESYYGKLDQFDVWDTELSGSEVLAAYNAGPEDPGDPNAGPPLLRMSFNTSAGGHVPNEGGTDPNYYGMMSKMSIVGPWGSGDRKADFSDPNGFIDIRVGTSDTLPPALADPNGDGITLAYWLKYNTSSISYMSLLTTGTNGNNTIDSIQNALKYPSGSPTPPYTSRRLYDFGWDSSTEYAPDTWIHVVYTYEPLGGGDPNFALKVYADGALVGSTMRGPLKVDDTTARLGILFRGSRLREAFDGEIDQMDLFGKALTGIQVLTLFNEGPNTDVLADPISTEAWLSFTFNVAALGSVYDVIPNQGTNPNYYGKAYNLTYSGTSADPNDGKKAVFADDPNADDGYIDITDGTVDTIPSDLHEANGMTVTYWLKYDLADHAYMALLTTGKNGNNCGATQLYHSLRDPRGTPVPSSPYAERVIMDYRGLGSEALSSRRRLDSGVWHHVAYRYTMGTDPNITEEVFHNGELVEAGVRDYMVLDCQSTILGFLNVRNESFYGEMEQFDIYDYALSDFQISYLSAEGPAPFTAPTACAEVIAWGFGMSFDLDDDCVVGVEDFGLFNKEWLKCMEPSNSVCDRPWDL